MSEAYIINPRGQSPDWSLNQAEFIEQLKNRWSGIEIRENVSEGYIIWWTVEIEGCTLLGGVQSDYQTLTIDGGAIANIAEFISWYRLLVSEQHPLFLYKGSTFDNPIELHSTTSKTELVKMLMRH